MSSVKFSIDQQKAINTPIANTLISAAAGSGKTAVLTKRIVNKLLDGVAVEHLIVLTFTNASAADMKKKIYEAVEKEEKLQDILPKINNANIMTFDAYALSLVKKYHYLLDIDEQIAIADQTIFTLHKQELLNEIIMQKISEREFINLMDTYSLLNIESLKTDILSFYNILNNNIEIKLNLDKYKESQFVDKIVADYLQLIKDIQLEIEQLLTDIEEYIVCPQGEKHLNALEEGLSEISLATDYEQLSLRAKQYKEKKPSASKKLINIEQINNITVKVAILANKLVSMSVYETIDNLKQNYLLNQNQVDILIHIINELDTKLNQFKKTSNLYEFIDIKRLSIKLLENNDDIRLQIKEQTNEILLDEYQDTDDVQEYFVSLIAKDNVYMVGDIKQSIYGFRNANPEIFINKYTSYEQNNGGNLISLNKNFRSNEQVITAINKIFINLMDDKIGGVEYDEKQQLVYSNKSYEIQEDKTLYDLELLNYSERNSKLHDAITIAKDINHKIQSGFKIVDRGELRLLKYSDILILTRGKSIYDTYNQVFEAFSIPLHIHSQTKFKTSYDILICVNLISLINNLYTFKDNRHELISILRSFIFEYDDELINQVMSNYNKEAKLIDNLGLVQEVKDLLIKFNAIKQDYSIESTLSLLIAETKLLENSIYLEDGELSFERLTKLIDIANTYDQTGASFNDFNQYLQHIKQISFTGDVDFTVNNQASDVVQIMTIHKSKGLEFPLVYVAQLDSRYKTKLPDYTFNFNQTYGMYTNYIKDTKIITPMHKYLIEEQYKISQISEEIRLLYVALTRAESKLVLVANFSKQTTVNDIKEQRNLSSHNLDMINLLGSELNEYLVDVEITEQDLEIIEKQEKEIPIISSDIKVENIDYELDYTLTSSKRASKEVSSLFTKEIIKNIKIGDELHHFLEFIDFKNPQYDVLNAEETKIVNNLLKYDIINDNLNMFSEYEFYDNELHAIIDLLIEREDEFIILDYKTSDITDQAYLQQLETYKTYLESKTDKKIRICLYSIYQDTLQFF